MADLDIRSFKTKDKFELMKEIQLAVNDTQRVVIQPYPDTIKMTQAQYEILEDDPSMLHSPRDRDKMYRTRYNVMEVIISI